MAGAGRNDWLIPLGLQRCRVLECLGCTDPRSPGFLKMPSDADAFTAFRTHAEALYHRWSDTTHQQTIRLLAAARVLIGDLAAADVILDQLPMVPYQLDHGHGYCNIADLYALSGVLPLPQSLKDTTRWLAGSSEQTELRAWLAAHRALLQWVERDGVYVVAR